MQFNKEEWTENMIKKIGDKYGDLSDRNKSKIKSFLHLDWCHSSERLLSIVTHLVGYGVGGLAQFPFSLFNIQLLNAIGLSAGYIATQIGMGLTIGSNLSRLPSYDALTDQQLDGLFKKADDINEFIQLLAKLEEVYSQNSRKDDLSHVAAIGGFVAGGMAISQVAPKLTLVGAAALSRSLPKVFNSEYSIVKSVVDVPFEDKLEKAESIELK